MLMKQEKTVSQLLQLYAPGFYPLNPQVYSRHKLYNWGEISLHFSKSDIGFDWQTHKEIEQMHI